MSQLNWSCISEPERARYRKMAVDAAIEAKTLRGAEKLLRLRGSPFAKKEFIKKSLDMAGISLEALKDVAATAQPVTVAASSSTIQQATSDTLRAELHTLVDRLVAERIQPAVTQPAATIANEVQGPELVIAALRRGPLSIADIAAKGQVSEETAQTWLLRQQAAGTNLHELGGKWSIERQAVIGNRGGTLFEYHSRADNTYLFGAMGDTHLASQYERLDVLNRLYDRYADESVDRVFHTGNWVDGEAHFNKHALKVHGMDNQLEYLVEQYPIRPGIETYAVTGDDHEGWWTAREGVDPGVRAEQSMRRAGRADWHNLGYMEANIALVNANTGKSAVLQVSHPGGGSAYALSYSIQKIVESYDGGEKPAVGLYGHYHKLWSGNIRNVWCVQTGCTMDQGTFMRKKRLEAHVGGCLVKLTQDPETGAIVEMTVTLLRYFNVGYYNDRWRPTGNPVLPERR